MVFSTNGVESIGHISAEKQKAKQNPNLNPYFTP